MAIRPVQHSTTRARGAMGTRRHEHDGHDASSCRAVPALRAEHRAQHEPDEGFSCRAGTMARRQPNMPSCPCQPAARQRRTVDGRRRQAEVAASGGAGVRRGSNLRRRRPATEEASGGGGGIRRWGGQLHSLLTPARAASMRATAREVR
jgi:hypothetical protein